MVHSEHVADPPSWADLTPGCHVTVVKRAPDGTEAARYPGAVVATTTPDAWVIVRATWTYPPVEVDGLAFMPGDLLLEWFSPAAPFNAFAVFSPQFQFRGWYANVTQPAFLAADRDPSGRPVLVWHDLYLDLVGLPDGTCVNRDEDELEASRLDASDPDLHRSIIAAGHELRRRFTHAQLPFVAENELVKMLDASR